MENPYKTQLKREYQNLDKVDLTDCLCNNLDNIIAKVEAKHPKLLRNIYLTEFINYLNKNYPVTITPTTTYKVVLGEK